MSLIRDALNKAQQEQDAARTGRPAPRFTPSYSRPNSGNGPAAKIFGGLIALGAIMGGAALFLQLFYPMSKLAESPPVPARAPEAAPASSVAVKITPPKAVPPVSAPPVATTPPVVAPVPAPTPSPAVASVAVPVAPTVPAIPVVPVPTPPPVAPPPVAAVIAVAPPLPPPVSTPVTTPAATPASDPSQQLVEFVESLAIRAVMVNSGGSRVSIQGRVFQSGDFLPGAPKPLRLFEITKDTLTFKDNAGNSYTKRL